MISRRVIVSGRVQGVWFREATRRLAERENVAGWVRNNDDGTVEAVFEGEPAAVERLIGFCHLGPPDARVDAVEVTVEEPRGLAGFVAG
jgi:acylphosphatase